MFAGWRHVSPNYNHIKRAGTGAGFDKTRSPGTGTSHPLQHCTQPRLASHITWLLWWLGRVRFVRLVENHHWKWWSKYNLILPFFLRVLFSLATPHIALLRVKIHVYPLPRDPMWPGLGWAGLGWATGHFTSVVTSIISPDTKQHYLLLDTCILGVGLQMNRISNISDASLF